MRKEKVIEKVIDVINDGVVLMTTEEEKEYKQWVVDELQKWVNILGGE